jgi:hypothetical protein
MKKVVIMAGRKKLSLWILLGIILIAILLIVFVLEGGSVYNKFNKPSDACVRNSDCIIIRGSCCSCEDGGAPQCISKSKLSEYAKELESCSKSGACLGFECEKLTCSCVANACVGKPV